MRAYAVCIPEMRTTGGGDYEAPEDYLPVGIFIAETPAQAKWDALREWNTTSSGVYSDDYPALRARRIARDVPLPRGDLGITPDWYERLWELWPEGWPVLAASGVSSVEERGPREEMNEERLTQLRSIFPDDALRRLERASYDYYSTHGDYLPGLASLLLATSAERDALEEALREEFFRRIHDLDYEVDVPSTSGAFDDRSETGWAWQEHPWKKLLGITDAECFAALGAKEANTKENP